MGFIDLVEMTDTDYSSAAVKAQKFLDAALTRGASVAITAHNHPFGPSVPSIGDIETNSMVRQAYSSAGVLLLEHYLIFGKSYVGIINQDREVSSDASAVKRFVASKGVGV
jgi:DNA repair protein RadC